MAEGYPVELWVFDVTPEEVKALIRPFLGVDGIWHTHIVVYGTEYYFNAGTIKGEKPGTTDYESSPYKKIDLGRTPKSQSQFHRWINSVAAKFSSSKYNPIKRNCNHFIDDGSKFLLGKAIPNWITRVPEEALSNPLGEMIRPWLENNQSELPEQIKISPFWEMIRPAMELWRGYSLLEDDNDKPKLPVVNPAFDKEFRVSQSMYVDYKDEKEELFEVGDRVEFHGLKAKEYNGKFGMIIAREKTGRWYVVLEMDSSVRHLKPSNLRLAPRGEKAKPAYETLCGLKPISDSDDNEDSYKRFILDFGNLSVEETSCLEKLVDFVKQKNTVADQAEYLNFLKTMLMIVPEIALDSFFALFRNFVHKNKAIGIDMDFMNIVQQRIPKKNYNVYFLFVTTCANLVVNGIKDIESAMEIAVDALESDNEQLRKAGALLAYNISLVVSKDFDDCPVSLFCSLLALLKEEKNTTILNQSLISIGVLIRDDETLAQLLTQMEVDFEKIKAAGTPKTAKIVQDLMSILDVSRDMDELTI